jgi:hypothetical protein
LILFQRRIYYFFHFFSVPLYNLRYWHGYIILFNFPISFFVATRTFVRFIFHSKFIEPSINTHIVKHCDGINMFSSSENFHTYKTFPFSDLYQDILAHRYQFYFYRDSKRNVERFFLKHNIFILLILFQHRIYYFFLIFSWFLYTTSVIDMVT